MVFLDCRTKCDPALYALSIKRTKTQWWVRCLGTVLHGLVNTLGLCISASGFSFTCSPVIKHDEMVRSQDEVAKILGAFLTPLPLTPIASFWKARELLLCNWCLWLFALELVSSAYFISWLLTWSLSVLVCKHWFLPPLASWRELSLAVTLTVLKSCTNGSIAVSCESWSCPLLHLPPALLTLEQLKLKGAGAICVCSSLCLECSSQFSQCWGNSSSCFWTQPKCCLLREALLNHP